MEFSCSNVISDAICLVVIQGGKQKLFAVSHALETISKIIPHRNFNECYFGEREREKNATMHSQFRCYFSPLYQENCFYRS